MSPERWAPAPVQQPRLGDDEVHLWRADLDQDADSLDALARLLDADERARAARIRPRDPRRRFVAARGFLRALLARYLDVAPASVAFAYGAKGKPALAATGAALRFNLSHSHDLALCAVTRGREVGVDVERRRELAARELAARFFSAAERAFLGALDGAAAAHAFFRLWTCKEAYLKAVGTGVSRPLAEVEVGLDDGPEARLTVRGDPAESARWSLRTLEVDAAHTAALAIEGRDWRLTCWRWQSR